MILFNTMMAGWRIAALVAVVLPLAACTALFSPLPPPLVGTTWQVVELQGEPFTAPGGEAFTLRLRADGRMQAWAGCNALGGSYQLSEGSGSEGRLRVGPFDLLPALCAPDIAVLERKVIHAMEGASRYARLEDGTLALRNPIQITLIRFRALP